VRVRDSPGQLSATRERVSHEEPRIGLLRELHKPGGAEKSAKVYRSFRDNRKQSPGVAHLN
jgi:hypothetical protein